MLFKPKNYLNLWAGGGLWEEFFAWFKNTDLVSKFPPTPHPTNWCGKWIILKTILKFTIIRERIMSNALPDDGVTAPKHVGAVLMLILM